MAAINYESPINKKILEAFRRKECFADMTEIVQYVIDTESFDSGAPFGEINIENEGNYNKRYMNLKDKMDELETKEPDNLTSDEWINWYNEYQSVEEEMISINLSCRWILVSPFLGNMLRDHKEQIIDMIDYVFWAIPTEQEIENQKVLCELAEELEILDGQKNSWAKYME